MTTENEPKPELRCSRCGHACPKAPDPGGCQKCGSDVMQDGDTLCVDCDAADRDER